MNDPLDRLLRPLDVDPLAPPTGHFQKITRRARSRRRYRTAGAGLLTVAVVAGAATGGILLARPNPTPDGPPNPPAASASSGATPTPGPSGSSAPAPALGTGPVPPGFLPRSVSYVSSTVGFLLGDAPCARPPCTSLAVTGDGGRTWRGLPAPRAPLPASRVGDQRTMVTVSDVRFANPRDGWVFGDALFSTHDGGRHWHRQAFSLPAGDLAVLDVETDGRTAYALAATCGSAASRCRPQPLFQTPVAADEWQPVAGVNSGARSYGGELALSGPRGILVLFDSPVSRAWAYRSTWTPATLPSCATGPPPVAVAASASSGRLVAFCGEGAAGSLYLSPWVSDDDGITWRQVASGSARVTGGLLSVAAASSTLLLIAAGNPDTGGTVLRSTDGGRTFADAGLPQRPAGWSYVGARSSSALVALPGNPDGSVWSSRDGGRTWQDYRFR